MARNIGYGKTEFIFTRRELEVALNNQSVIRESGLMGKDKNELVQRLSVGTALTCFMLSGMPLLAFAGGVVVLQLLLVVMVSQIKS